MKKTLLIASAAALAVAGGLPEDIVTEPKVVVKEWSMPDKQAIVKSVTTVPAVKKVEHKHVVNTNESAKKPAVIAPSVVKKAEAEEKEEFKTNFFLEAGVGIVSARESIKWFDSCGQATECYGNTDIDGAALMRVGYDITESLSAYAEILGYRGEVDYANLKYLDITANVRYTAYDKIKVFAGYGKQKVSIRSTRDRDVFKVGAGHNFTDWLSGELHFIQTGKIKYPHSRARNRAVGAFFIVKLGGL